MQILKILLSLIQGKKALKGNVPLSEYKVVIPCEKSIDIDFTILNQVKSHNIQDLKKFILESRDVSISKIISFSNYHFNSHST